eukprot:8021119-Pyramimonas_sp.AAC.2
MACEGLNGPTSMLQERNERKKTEDFDEEELEALEEENEQEEEVRSCFTEYDWKIVSTYEPRNRTLARSPAQRLP